MGGGAERSGAERGGGRSVGFT